MTLSKTFVDFQIYFDLMKMNNSEINLENTIYKSIFNLYTIYNSYRKLLKTFDMKILRLQRQSFISPLFFLLAGYHHLIKYDRLS